MKISQSLQIPACSAVLVLATVWPAGAASDGASFVSETIPTNTVMAPGQIFTETWTLQNSGTSTWSPGANGYTLILAGTDSLGAVPLSTNALSKRVHPYATISGGSSVAPGATATFSLYFIAPETTGTYQDSFQMASTNGVSFGPQVTVQIIVQQAGPTGQYDRAKAVSYANNYAGFVVSDGYFWTNGSDYGYFGALAPAPTNVVGDDCAHFVSSCIGSQPSQKGGGLTIPSRASPTYGEPGAARLVSTVLLGGGLATEVTSLSSLSPGDVIAWNWEGETNMADIDHDTIYLGNGLLAAHSASCLDVSATKWYPDSEPYWEWHLIHILDKADTIPPVVWISSPTNGQTLIGSTIAVSGTADDPGCPSTGVGLVESQVNGTNGTWQTASGTTNWSASPSLISGANTIHVRSRDGAGNYSTVASVNVTYAPTPQGPSITNQPQSQTVLVGQSVTFSVGASGTAPLSYQWQFNGNGIPGATAAVFTLASACCANAGLYSVVVTNATGIPAVSSNAVLVVTVVDGGGDDSLGQLDAPAESADAIAIAAGAWHSLALDRYGTVTAWGDNSLGQTNVPAGLSSNVVAIAGGGYHSLAILGNGTVAAWGADDYSQTNVPAGLSSVMGISAGTWHSVALRANGTVVVWGDNSFGQTNQPAGLTNVTAVAAGGSHTLALTASGMVVAWGENTDAEGNVAGQSVVPWGLTNVAAIGAGEYHSLAVRADGTVTAWGDDSQGQCDVPVGLSNVVAVAGGGAHSLALQADGTVTAWGADWNGQCNVPAMSGIVGIGAGEYDSLVLLAGSVPVPQLLNPVMHGANRNRPVPCFSALAQTLNRGNYALEFKDSLAATNWTALSSNPGNGALLLLSDTNAAAPQRFYRLRQW